MARPNDAEGWQSLRNEVNEAFSPGSPIRALTELSGRAMQRQRLSDIMLRAGEHAIVYGERGVGKTSLARTFHAALKSNTRQIQECAINCVEADTFTSLWRRVFKRLGYKGTNSSFEGKYDNEITPDDVLWELSRFSLNDLPIIIFDEFDRLTNPDSKNLMTDTVKLLSDDRAHAKLIFVGVADDVGELISRHKSLSRNLKQVRMPRLTLSESESIVGIRLKKCGMTIEQEASFQIAFLSRGLPYFSHLVGQYAALSAVDDRHVNVTEPDVLEGLGAALQDVDQTITEAYLQAIISQRPDETLYEPVLIACALADSDELGRFQQTAVTDPLAKIVEKTPPYTAATFAFHMNKFCEDKRGKILTRTGESRNYRYQFSDPMMQPNVILRALESKRLNMEVLQKFMARRQRDLSI
ncbi:MAG: orc1/cdc6 family replication initiation protein [Proteobacteria bacterium]|nr:orc1/cdc6 family replication initiation protein [Pseudomonadota bacterium]